MKSDFLIVNADIFDRLWSIKCIAKIKIKNILWVNNIIKIALVGEMFIL
jgi:hypothetical protein